jgi:hypothetical protein
MPDEVVDVLPSDEFGRPYQTSTSTNTCPHWDSNPDWADFKNGTSPLLLRMLLRRFYDHQANFEAVVTFWRCVV